MFTGGTEARLVVREKTAADPARIGIKELAQAVFEDG
jgi:hypothetical protein